VVDDPFGKSTGAKKSWSESNKAEEGSEAGNDAEWSWPNQKSGMYIFHVK